MRPIALLILGAVLGAMTFALPASAGPANTYIVLDTRTFTAGLNTSEFVECDLGDVVTGGGYRALSSPSLPYRVVGSFPTGYIPTTVPARWNVDVKNDHTLDVDLEVFAICES